MAWKLFHSYGVVIGISAAFCLVNAHVNRHGGRSGRDSYMVDEYEESNQNRMNGVHNKYTRDVIEYEEYIRLRKKYGDGEYLAENKYRQGARLVNGHRPQKDSKHAYTDNEQHRYYTGGSRGPRHHDGEYDEYMRTQHRRVDYDTDVVMAYYEDSTDDEYYANSRSSAKYTKRLQQYSEEYHPPRRLAARQNRRARYEVQEYAELPWAKAEDRCFCGNDRWSWGEILKTLGFSFASGAAAYYVVPILVGLVGFTPAGILGGSVAAGLMSWGYMPWLVGFLQSVGAAGVTWFTSLCWGLASGTSYWALRDGLVTTLRAVLAIKAQQVKLLERLIIYLTLLLTVDIPMMVVLPGCKLFLLLFVSRTKREISHFQFAVMQM